MEKFSEKTKQKENSKSTFPFELSEVEANFYSYFEIGSMIELSN